MLCAGCGNTGGPGSSVMFQFDLVLGTLRRVRTGVITRHTWGHQAGGEAGKGVRVVTEGYPRLRDGRGGLGLPMCGDGYRGVLSQEGVMDPRFKCRPDSSLCMGP